ncbi:MAG: prepilin-type N-terminal cleavage/methylation domain-containing protein [Gammaproteobacteria bacterium]
MNACGTVVHCRPIRRRARLRGFTLVEMMIAMTLSLLVLAAIGWVYMGTMRTYRSHDSLSRMQEGARYAFEVIGKDLRMIGALSCSNANNANALSDTTAWYKNLFGEPLGGKDQDGASASYTQFSDSLSAVRADVSHEYIVQLHNSASTQVHAHRESRPCQRPAHGRHGLRECRCIPGELRNQQRGEARGRR